MFQVHAGIAMSLLLLGGCQAKLAHSTNSPLEAGKQAHQARGDEAPARRSLQVSTDGPGLTKVDWAAVRVLPGSRCRFVEPAACRLGSGCTVSVELDGPSCVVLVREFSRLGNEVRSSCHDLSQAEAPRPVGRDKHASCVDRVKTTYDAPKVKRRADPWWWGE